MAGLPVLNPLPTSEESDKAILAIFKDKSHAAKCVASKARNQSALTYSRVLRGEYSFFIY
jgi:hypothetical protein